jgi:hypothetical protein
MNAMHIPGLDQYLTVEDAPRRRFRCPEDAVAELSDELLADHSRMRALFEEDATTQDVSELVEELIELRFLLSRPETDTSAARDLAITRRDMASKAKKLAADEAQYQVDNA